MFMRKKNCFIYLFVLNTYNFVLYKVTHYFVVKVFYWCPSNSFLHIFFLLSKMKEMQTFFCTVDVALDLQHTTDTNSALLMFRKTCQMYDWGEVGEMTLLI